MRDHTSPLSTKFALGMSLLLFLFFFCPGPLVLGFPEDLTAYFSQAALAYTTFLVTARFLERLMGQEFRYWKVVPIVILAAAAASLASYTLSTLFGWHSDLVFLGIALMTAWVILAPLHI